MYVVIGIRQTRNGLILDRFTVDTFSYKYQEVVLNPYAWHLEVHDEPLRPLSIKL